MPRMQHQVTHAPAGSGRARALGFLRASAERGNRSVDSTLNICINLKGPVSKDSYLRHFRGDNNFPRGLH